MAPEQAAGAAVDARADVYALGAMLYHLLAGRRPRAATKAGRLSQVEPRLPIDLVTIVEKAMASSPADRYPTAGEMAADLRRFQTGQLVGAHHYTAWQLLRRLVGRRPAAFSLGALVVLAIVFALAMLVVRQARIRELRGTKRALDARIVELENAMADTRDPVALLALEDQIDDTIGQARVASHELAGAGAAVARGDDALERRIHAVLAGFDADTYSIPPRFRDVVAAAMNRSTDLSLPRLSSVLRKVYGRSSRASWTRSVCLWSSRTSRGWNRT